MKRDGSLALLGVLGFLAAAGAAGCASTDSDWRERYLEKEKDATDAAAQLSEERSAHSAAIAQLEEARTQLANLQRENDTLKSRPAEMTPAAGVESTGAVPGAVAEKVDQLKKDGLDVHMTPDGNIAIVLSADINFGAGSKELTPAGKKALEKISKELEGPFAGYSIRIEGHTDSDPIRKSNFKDNWELAAERSLAVLRCLQGEHGVAPERLIAASRGDTVPVADNKTDKGKARNRRVEVVVLLPRDSSMAK